MTELRSACRILSAYLLLPGLSAVLLHAQDFPTSTSDTNVGYIDSAAIANRIRLRADAGFDMFPPDRAEFFYSATPDGSPVSHVDYQELSQYLELALNDSFSGFVEAPLRFIDPDNAKNTTGIADINLGFKAMLLGDEQNLWSFQFRVYLPTGDNERRLGTGNVNIEPGLLQIARLSDSWLMENEFKVWLPLTANDFAGPVLRYGVGISHSDRRRRPCDISISPVLEMVGWTVLDGKATTEVGMPTDASGDTIVNAKLGLRLSYKREQLYAGFGQVVTSDRWYRELARIEYRFQF